MKKEVPGEKALIFKASEVAWATSKFVDKRIGFAQKVFIHTLFVTLIVFTVYAYFTKIALTFEATGKLTSISDIVTLKAQANFIPATVNAENGLYVQKDQIIAESKDAIADTVILDINTKIEMILSQITMEKCLPCLDKLREIKNTIFEDLQDNRFLREFNPTVLALNKYILAAESLYNFGQNNAALISAKKRAKVKIDRIKRQRSQRLLRVELERLTGQYEEADTKLTQLKDQASTQYEAALSEMKNSLSELPSIISKVNDQNRIVAPSEGIVANSTLQVGQLVQAGQETLSLIPNESELKAIVYIPNKDIGEVKDGQKVKINLEAYPEREYGSLFGQISSVDADSVNRDNIGETYQAEVLLEKQFVEKNGKKYPLKLGMVLTGKIIKKRERLLIVGVRKLLNLKDEMLGE